MQFIIFAKEHASFSRGRYNDQPMKLAPNSSGTNRLVQRAGCERDPKALEELFGRHRERLRKMVRLRLDGKLRSRFSSSAVLHQVYQDASRRIDEYVADPRQSLFLWLRQLTGEQIQRLHRQHLRVQGHEPGNELSLYRGALPEVNALSMAAQLLGHRAANQSAVRADLLLRLQDALNALNPLDREILALCHFEELTEAELATVLGLDEDDATLRYFRALKKLKEILSLIPGFF